METNNSNNQYLYHFIPEPWHYSVGTYKIIEMNDFFIIAEARCNHDGPNCKVKVELATMECIDYLNESAERYKKHHEGKYYFTSEPAAIEMYKTLISEENKKIDNYIIKAAESKLKANEWPLCIADTTFSMANPFGKRVYLVRKTIVENKVNSVDDLRQYIDEYRINEVKSVKAIDDQDKVTEDLSYLIHKGDVYCKLIQKDGKLINLVDDDSIHYYDYEDGCCDVKTYSEFIEVLSRYENLVFKTESDALNYLINRMHNHFEDEVRMYETSIEQLNEFITDAQSKLNKLLSKEVKS